MRRIILPPREDRGASAVLVGLLMVPLIGFLAIALDVGALYAERAQLQNGADAAALAVAQNCADGVCTTPAAQATAFSNANANDGAANTLTPSFPTSSSVTVQSSTRESGSNAPAISHPFASLIGVSSTTVRAEATAEWGSPRASRVILPLAISYCEFPVAAVTGALQLIRYDLERSCPSRDGRPIPGGFGWLERETGRCSAFIDLRAATAPSEPGNSYPDICDATLTGLEGETVLVPVYDGASVRSGRAASYNIYAFAAFELTGWKFAGGTSYPRVSIDRDAPSCTGNCRGIQGRFVNWVFLDAAGVELGGPTLGASVVRLTR